jgi:hypothetical protein
MRSRGFKVRKRPYRAVVTASVFFKIFIGMGKLMRVWTGATQQMLVIDSE